MTDRCKRHQRPTTGGCDRPPVVAPTLQHWTFYGGLVAPVLVVSHWA